MIVQLISNLIGQELVYGENDCHLIVLSVLDISIGTDYHSQYYRKYTSAKSGWQYSRNTEYPTLKELLNKVATKSDVPCNGAILMNGSHATVYWNGRILVLNNNKYELTDFQNSTEWEIFLIRK